MRFTRPLLLALCVVLAGFVPRQASADHISIIGGSLTVTGVQDIQSRGFLRTLFYDFDTELFSLRWQEPDGIRQDPFAPFLPRVSSYRTDTQPERIVFFAGSGVPFVVNLQGDGRFTGSLTTSITDEFGALLFNGTMHGWGTVTFQTRDHTDGWHRGFWRHLPVRRVATDSRTRDDAPAVGWTLGIGAAPPAKEGLAAACGRGEPRREQRLQFVWIGRLHDMRVEAGLSSPPLVFCLSPTRDRHQEQSASLGIAPEVLGERVSAHARHADVEEADLRGNILRNAQGILTALHNGDVVPSLRQKGTKQLPAFDIVIDDENAQSC